jgi:ABC-2 type transport system permease protein
MMLQIARTAATALRRDRGALLLSFVLPVAFFSIFAVIFGGSRDTTPRIGVIVVDQDRSPVSEGLVEGLRGESLTVRTRAARGPKAAEVDYTAEAAEAAVRAGEAPVAIIIPRGFADRLASPATGEAGVAIQLLRDPSDLVAPQVVAGLLQKVAMTSVPELMLERGSGLVERYLGELTAEQRRRVDDRLGALRARRASGAPIRGAGGDTLISIATRDVVGTGKHHPMISFYAAAIGVMFLLFTASGAGGSLLDEVESGALDRVLGTRVTMGSLLAGKLLYCTVLAFSQLLVMFLWARAAFGLELLPHLGGFAVMGFATSFAAGAFGMLLASVCRTRAQLGALSTLLVLVMSSIGGSMFPRFLMPELMQKAGLFTLNAWAIDGFTKVFWRDEPVVALWPQVLVLVAAGTVLFAGARRLARRWEKS